MYSIMQDRPYSAAFLVYVTNIRQKGLPNPEIFTDIHISPILILK